MPGKNVVDLGVEASPDDIPDVVDALLSLGFQRQGGLAPFPPTRPLALGNVDHDGTSYRVHFHVMPPARHELAELLAFRDALRTDPALRDGYAASKQDFVEQAPDGDANLLYTVYKGDFVQDALYRLGIRRPPADAPVPLAPGATIGILGGGQLGRMLGIAARAMGYRIVALDPDPACPTAAVADEIVVGAYDDPDAARRLARMSDVVTYELEHVGLDAAAAAGEVAPLRPGLASLRATRDRLAERRFIREIGEWAAPWREVRDVDDARAAADALGYPRPPQDGDRWLRRPQPGAGHGPGGGRGSRAWRWVARRSARCSWRRRSTSRPSSPSSAPATATVDRSASRSPGTSTTPASSSRAWRPPRCIRSSPRMPARSRTASSAASTSSACSRSSCSSSAAAA